MSLHSDLKNSVHAVWRRLDRADLTEQLPEVESQDQAYERWRQKVGDPETVAKVTAQYQEGLELENRRSLKQAKVLYGSQLAEHPEFANAACRLGYVLDALNDFPAAMDAFIRASEIDPQFDLVYFRAGQMMKHVERVDEAETAYRKAIELNPRFAAARGNLGLLLIDSKDWEGAKEQFRAMLEDFPNARNAKRNLGFAEAKRGRGGGGCFIAAAAMGSDTAVEVNVLREFRDAHLVRSPLGRALVTLYYALSPRPARWIGQRPATRALVRGLIVYPAVRLVRLLQKTEFRGGG